MRPYSKWLLVLACLHGWGAAAVDLDKIRYILTNQNVQFEWTKRSAQGNDVEVPGFDASVTNPAPGQLVYTRTENGKTGHYNIELKNVYTFAINLPLETKSSSCEKTKANTRCTLHIKIPLVGYELVPIDGPALKDETRTLNTSEMSMKFTSEWFPEIAKLNDVQLECNDWGWASQDGKNVSFLDVSIDTDTRVSDLEKNTPALSTLVRGPVNCAITDKSCTLADSSASTNFTDYYYFTFVNAGVAFEVADTDGTCITEFGSAVDPNTLFSGYSAGQLPLAPPEINNPEVLHRMQLRLDEKFLEAYRQNRANQMLKVSPFGFLNNGSLGDFAVLIDRTWEHFTGLADENGTNQKCETDKNNNQKCTNYIEMKDNLSQGNNQ